MEMGWREALKHLLGKVSKRALVDGYIHIVETMGDDEDERRKIAREMAVTIQAHRYVKGEIKSLDGFDEEFRKEVEAEVEKLRIAIA